MLSLAARCRGCAIAACATAHEHSSGVFLPDELLANRAKLSEVDAISEATTILINIVGGLVGTIPS